MRRLAVALATLCLLAGQTIFAGVASGADPSRFTATPLTADSTYVGAKSTSGAIAKSDPALLGRTDATTVNVMIKYDYDVAASYAGGVAGLAATSPRVTGKSMKANADAVRAYDAYTASLSTKITARAQKAVSGLKVRFTYSTAYGGVEASVPANQIAALLKVGGVVAVQSDTLEQPLDDNTAFIGATAVWPSLGGSANAGSNVVVGVIDTGVWPEHPSFADDGTFPAPAGTLENTAANPSCNFGNTAKNPLDAPFTCNNKLIGAREMLATYRAVSGQAPDEYDSARDDEGHGTHTASTAAGDANVKASIFGTSLGRV